MAGQARLTDPEKLKAAFTRAAEIAAVVPESMQEAAFHRALDQILGTGAQGVDMCRRPHRVLDSGSRRRVVEKQTGRMLLHS